VTAPIRDVPSAVRALGALPVPLGRRDIADLDVSASRLEQRIRDLADQQRKDRAGESAARLRAFLAATTQPDTTSEEGQL
jgi:hypothetical protein